jgi:hypothetical protein
MVTGPGEHEAMPALGFCGFIDDDCGARRNHALLSLSPLQLYQQPPHPPAR